MKNFIRILKIFNIKDRIKLGVLTLQLIIGAFFELVGVSLFLPLIQMFTEADSSGNILWKLMPDFVKNFDRTNQIIVICLLLIVVYIVKNLFLAYSLHYQYKFIYDFQNRTRTTLLSRYMNKPYLYYTQNNSADMNRSLTSDVYNFSDYLIGILQLVSEGIICIVLVAFLAYSDIVITLVILVLFLLISFFYFIPTRKKLVTYGLQNQQAYSEFVKCMNQAWGSIKEIKVSSSEKYFIQFFGKSSGKYAESKRRMQFMSAFPRFLLESIIIVGIAAAIIVRVSMGGFMSDMISRLSIFAVVAYRLMPSVNRINAYYGMANYNKASVDLVYNDLLNSEEIAEEKCDNIKNEFEKREEIAFRNISFRYPESDTRVLDSVDLTIPVGQSIGLTGKTGSGKTTLVDILLGLLDPEEGYIIYEGQDIRNDKKVWLKKVGYIPQNIYILDDTIRNNVAFGIPEEKINDDDIWLALREAQMEDFVNELEQGLDTIVGELGARLSGGQCQRLGIARVLFRKPEIIVMDESTSALDNKTEMAVMEAIEHLHGKVTLIIIAHRLSTVEKCDAVYEVKEGKVYKT